MSRGRRLILFATPPAGFAATLVLASCAHVKVDPITIYAKLDANVRLQLDEDVKALIRKNPDLF